MEKLHISYPFIIFSSVLLALDRDGLLLLAWVAVAVHELGHILCIRLTRCAVDKIQIGLGGLSIEYSAGRQISYGKEALIALAGPVTNVLLIIILTIAACRIPSRELYFLIGANSIVALFNLLPAMPTDGGRVLLALTSKLLGDGRGTALTQLITAITGTLMAAMGVWVMMETHGNFMLLASSIIILCGLFAKKLYRTA